MAVNILGHSCRLQQNSVDVLFHFTVYVAQIYIVCECTFICIVYIKGKSA